MISRKWGLGFLLVCGLSTASFAVEFYDINIATHVMRGDQNVFFSITAMSGGAADGDHNVSIDFDRTGIFSSPSTVNGPISWTGTFQLVTDVSAVGGIPTNMTVLEARLGGISSQKTVFIDRTIKSFDIFLPDGPTGVAGTPFPVIITAKDSLGATVLGFNDTATIRASIGDIRVDGTGNTITFVDGMATISLEVFGTDPETHNTTLTVEADTVYLGESRVSNTKDISIIPGAYEKMVLLFPGEILKPGDLGFLAFGKDSQAIATQTSNIAVASVEVYLVDHYNNPILNPGVDVYLGFDSEVAVAPPDLIPASGSVAILSAGGPRAGISGGFTMYQAGGHTIRAYDLAHPLRQSRSNVTVIAGAPSQLEFLGGSIQNQRAGVTFTIYARIHDGTPARNDTSINADVTLQLTDCNPGGIVYPAKALDARGSVPGLQSQVHFSGGFLGGGTSPGLGETITVYLRPGDPHVCLELDGGAGLGGRVVSNTFVMQQGPNTQLLVVLPGQSYTNGLYPGVNPAVPAPRSVGIPDLNLQVYVVDDGWNQLNNVQGDFIPNTPVQVQMETGYMDVPAGPFPMLGTGGPCPINGVVYRTAFPQGNGRIHAMMGGIDGYSSLLTLNPGAYDRLVFIAPGETFDPGQSTTVKAVPDGELGIKADQPVNSAFAIHVRLADAFFNPIAFVPAGGWPTLNFSFSGGHSGFPSNPIPTGNDDYAHNLILTSIGPNTITVTDSTGKTISQGIDVVSGDPVRFVVTPDKNNDTAVINSGVPLLVGQNIPLYFKAYDAYDNLAKSFAGDVRIKLLETVDGIVREVTTPGVITPANVTFEADLFDGGISSTTVVITYAGDQMSNGIDGLQVQAVYEPTGVHGESEKFNMKELPSWDALVMTLPGETRYKGRRDSVFKGGTPSSVFAGDDVQVTLTFIDRYGNQVNQNGDVVVSVPNLALQNSIPLGQTLSVVGGSKSDFFMKVFTASSTVIFATANTSGSSSSTVTVAAGGYAGNGRLLLLAPGETRIGGAQSTPGKSGVATPLQAYDTTTVTLMACDAYFNPTTYTGGSLSLASSDGFYTRSGIGLVDGVATVPNVGLLGSAPYPRNVTLTAADAARTSLSSLSVLQGAEYQFTSLPTSAVAGSTITLELTLFDPLRGPPGPKLGANHFVNIVSEKATGGASTVAVFPNTAQLVDGYVKVDLFYPHVENIVLRITDSFGRVAVSAPIAVLPTGLHYVMTAPTSASADSSFPLNVKLYDSTYNSEPIRDAVYQHAFNIWVTAGGGVALGTSPVSSASMNNGDVTVDFGYSKAESIVIHASGTVAGYSITGTASTLVSAGQYVKLQTLAPWEQALEGVPSIDGKDHSIPQGNVSAGEIFGLEVHAVDQYWNTVKTVFSGSAQLTSHPSAELNTVLPVPFSAGVAQFSGLTLRTAGLTRITGADANPLSGIVSQDVLIPVSGRLYVATNTVANPGPIYYTGESSGSPSFQLRLELREFSGNTIGDIVPNFGSLVAIQPQNAAGEDLPIGNLMVISPPVVGGSNYFLMPSNGYQTLTLRYRVAENVRFKFTDADGWSGYSDVFQFFPQNVRYEAVFPSSATVGPPGFSMTVMAIDTETNLSVKNWTDHVAIERISPQGTPVGVPLTVPFVDLSTGPYTIPAQIVTQAGLYKFRLDGDVGPVSDTTNTIYLSPGPLATMTTDLPATLEPVLGNTYSINVTLKDGYDNLIPAMPVTFALSDSGFGVLSTLTGTTGLNGQSQTIFTPNLQKSGEGEFMVTSGATGLRQSFHLLGPPTTSLSFGGRAVEITKGFNLKPDDLIQLTPEVEDGMTLTETCYSLDGGSLVCGPGPTVSFTIPEPGIHRIEYYSVSQLSTTHTESTKSSRSVYVSAVTTPAEGLVNYPNPFRAGVDLSFLEYNLAADAGVRLTIYDMMGQRVYEHSYSQGEVGGSSGLNRISWDGRNDDGVVVGNGGYVAVLEAADGTKLKRKIAVKK